MRLLTETEKEFIDANWQRLTYLEMADRFEFKSIHKVREYCQESGYKKDKKGLTDVQKEFVKANYKTLTETQLANELSISKFYVQEFKKNAGIKRYKYKSKLGKVKGIFFDVDARECWVA